MARDSYTGVPRVADSYIDKDGNTVFRTGAGNSFGAYVVGSGTLSDGYALIDCDSLGIGVGWHTCVMLTSTSGSYNTERLQYEIDVANKRIHVSGADSDDTQFSYFIVNPGIGSPKVS